MGPNQRPGLSQVVTCVSATLTRVKGTKVHVEFILLQRDGGEVHVNARTDCPTVQTALLFIFKNNNRVPESWESPIPPQPGAFLGAKQPRIAFITHFLWQKTKKAVKGSWRQGKRSMNNFILIQIYSNDSAVFPERSLWLLKPRFHRRPLRPQTFGRRPPPSSK